MVDLHTQGLAGFLFDVSHGVVHMGLEQFPLAAPLKAGAFWAAKVAVRSAGRLWR